MVYIRAKKLHGLKEYKYAGVDHSLVSRYILKPFYNNVAIKCFPMSMAPNAITLSGFSFVVINFLTMLWYNPSLDQDCPRWVYASWSIGLFLYQTFDAVDGTQARRTHQSGPLGELFDHGVDACNTVLEVLLFAATMNLGQSWPTVLTLFGTTLTFYVQTWDEYYTQTLTLGLVSGPVEGILTLCIVFAFTAIKGGGSFWQQSMLPTLGVAKYSFIPEYLYQLPFNEWFMVYGGIVLFFNTLESTLHVLEVRRQRSESTDKPLYGLLPFFVTWIFIPAYLYLQPIILHYHLIPFVFYVGLINAYSVGQIIVAHLTKSPKFPYQNVLTLPVALAVLDSAGPMLDLWPSVLGDGTYQIAFVFLCTGFALGVYGSFVHDIITTICDYLDIWCLTIKHPYDFEAEKKKAK
ncbi:ethanolaminephosphotransferase [Lasallia pustulata]|uniref:diacylglycerol cholinephosphotransferase n=2 Tax=Lasallia pustulata TaxID=136370 RepID=A0A1W5CV30_9LECA|nr:ethanolaminephosphotransferase [Lasallia pustulata]